MTDRVLDFELTLLTDGSDLPDFRSKLNEFACQADLLMSERLRLNLLLDELVSNTVTHGLANAAGHEIQLALRRREAQVSVVLRDDAPRFNPFASLKQLSDLLSDDRPAGGIGLHLLAHYAFEKRYRREGAWNITEFVLPLERRDAERTRPNDTERT